MHQIPCLDAQGLRKFGLTSAAIVLMLFGLMLPWLRDRPLPWWPWGVSAILLVWALIAPTSLNLVYRPWMKLGLMLGWINTRILLGVVFWVIILPLGIILRLVKEKKVSRMTSSVGASATTYWTAPTTSHRANMEKPF
jgi:hypothetical protein